MRAVQSRVAMWVGVLIVSSVLAYPYSKPLAQDKSENSGPLSVVQASNLIADEPSISRNLPPDPGEAGDIAIEGIDADQDGVRDDVERDIVMAYPDNAKARAVFYLIAGQYQSLLLNHTNKAAVLDSYGYLAAFEPCLNAATGNPDDSATTLRPWVLDTYERGVAYIKALKTIDGVLSVPSKSVTCPQVMLARMKQYWRCHQYWWFSLKNTAVR